MNNIDLQIYIAKLLTYLSDSSEGTNGYDAIRADFDMDEKYYTNQLIYSEVREEIELAAEANLLETGEPTLTMDQFEQCIVKAATRMLVDKMVLDGLLVAELDIDSGENVYKLTEKGKAITNNLI